MSSPSPVSEPIRELIDVFEARLSDVAFPEVSAAILVERARDLERAAAALDAAEEAVAEARRVHSEARTILDILAERGLGYARVYASDDEALLEQLGAIELRPKPARRRPPTKRKSRRTPKPTNVAELPLDDSRAVS